MKTDKKLKNIKKDENYEYDGHENEEKYETDEHETKNKNKMLRMIKLKTMMTIITIMQMHIPK